MYTSRLYMHCRPLAAWPQACSNATAVALPLPPRETTVVPERATMEARRTLLLDKVSRTEYTLSDPTKHLTKAWSKELGERIRSGEEEIWELSRLLSSPGV